MLSEEFILGTFAYNGAGVGKENSLRVARALESAVAAPLLLRIAELQAKLAKYECADNEIWKQVPRVNTRST